MNRPDWDQYFMTMAYLAASRSQDSSTHAGSVIVRPDNSVVSTGYNSPIRGMDIEDVPQERPHKYFYMEHSERNAIYNAAKHGTDLDGCKLYVNFLPCADCARGIVQAGISEVIVHKEGQAAFEEASGKQPNEIKWPLDTVKDKEALMKEKHDHGYDVVEIDLEHIHFVLRADKRNEWDASHQATMKIFDTSHTMLGVDLKGSMLRWWSGELWMPKGFFRGKEFNL